MTVNVKKDLTNTEAPLILSSDERRIVKNMRYNAAIRRFGEFTIRFHVHDSCVQYGELLERESISRI